MQTRPLVTALAMVMAISILASAVAMWYDTLKIHAVIETGEVDVEFGRVWCREAPEAEGKEVGDCSCSLEEVEDEGPDDDDLDLSVTISNAYPGYSCKVCFEVKNVGSIPVVGPWPSFELPELPDWLVISHGIVPLQIDPGDSETFCFWISVREDLEGGIEPPEDHTHTFQVYMDFVQWNEVVYEVLGLVVKKEFRHTSVSLVACPGTADIDGLLPMKDGYYVVYATVVKGKVKSVSPGAFFGVIWIMGAGVTEIHVVDSYDFHFDVEDGEDGKVRAYIYDTVNECIVHVLKLTENVHYTVDNESNIVKVDITLTEPLGPGQALLIYLKFKPIRELKDSDWESLDKFFENSVEVETNIGHKSGSATIWIKEKG